MIFSILGSRIRRGIMIIRLFFIVFCFAFLSFGLSVVEPLVSDDWTRTFVGHLKYDALGASLIFCAFASSRWIGSKASIRSERVRDIQMLLASIGLLALVIAACALFADDFFPTWVVIVLIGFGNASIAGAFFLREAIDASRLREFDTGKTRFEA